jgi:hypothetical protein
VRKSSSMSKALRSRTASAQPPAQFVTEAFGSHGAAADAPISSLVAAQADEYHSICEEYDR